MTAVDRLPDVVELAPHHRRAVERDVGELHRPAASLPFGHHGSVLPRCAPKAALLASKYDTSVPTRASLNSGGSPSLSLARSPDGTGARSGSTPRSANRLVRTAGSANSSSKNTTRVVSGNV